MSYKTFGNYKNSLAETFRLADKYQVGIDMHVHDCGDAGMLTIEEIIRLTKKYKMANRVFISHAFGLNDFTGSKRQATYQALAENGIQIVTSVPLDKDVIPPIMELLAANVKIHIGCDNDFDSWSPYGDGSIQEKLVRLGEMYNVKGQAELTQLLKLVTNGKTSLNMTGQLVWPQVNEPASFILTNASCSAEFVARKNKVNLVAKQGIILAD